MDESLNAPIQNLSESPGDGNGTPAPTVSRRDLLRLTLCGGAGLALDGLLDVSVYVGTNDSADADHESTRLTIAVIGGLLCLTHPDLRSVACAYISIITFIRSLINNIENRNSRPSTTITHAIKSGFFQ